VGVEQKAHGSLLPPIQLFRRQWLEELRTEVYLPLQRSGFTVSPGALDCYQAHHWLGPTRNYDVFPAAGLLDQPTAEQPCEW
jgi:hypothetical protein